MQSKATNIIGTMIETADITLWLMPYNNTTYQPSQDAINVLSFTELGKFNRCVNKRQKEYLLGRLLLRRALKHTLSDTPDKLDVIDRDGLPPHVPWAEKNRIQFSISHSSNVIAIAMTSPDTSHKIGLDIERIKPVKSFETTRFFCNHHQQLTLNNAQDQEQKTHLYYLYWTLKEAYLKAHHQGIGHKNFKHIGFNQTESKTGRDFYTSHFYHPDTVINEQYRIALYSSSSYQINTYVVLDAQPNSKKVNKAYPEWHCFNLNMAANSL